MSDLLNTLSGAVCCGHCGDNFRRIVWNNRGSKSAVWRCISRVQKKKSGIDCPARTVREKDLHEAVVIAVNDAWFDNYVYQAVVKKSLLKPELLKALDEEKKVLEPWDPMGTLAD